MCADLVVAPGQTLEINAPQDGTIFDLLQMGDNSTLIVKVDTRIQARTARFGHNCVIDGSASQQKPATPAKPQGFPHPAGQCDSGSAGHPAGGGTAGARGRNIQISIGLAELGSLKVISNGQPGGDGGPGGDGQQGGGAKCLLCRGGGGGPGAQGGTGGRGDDSGKIEFRWTPIDGMHTGFSSLNIDILEALRQGQITPANLVLEANAGKGGSPGPGGVGGRGGDGVDCGWYGQPGGDPGGTGPWGHPGANGIRFPPVTVME